MPAGRTLTDHEEIRQWAEARNAQPACVTGTGGDADPGMIRLDFPGFSGGESLQPISWDDWFKAFDQNSLALLVQDETAGGEQSNFNKLVSRETASGGRGGSRKGGGGPKSARGGKRKSAGGSRKSAGGTRQRTARGGRKSAGGSRKSSGGGRKSAGGSRKSSRSARTTRGRSSGGGAKRR